MLQVTHRNISYNIKGRSTSQLETLPMNIVDLMRQNIVGDFLFIAFIMRMLDPKRKKHKEREKIFLKGKNIKATTTQMLPAQPLYEKMDPW